MPGHVSRLVSGHPYTSWVQRREHISHVLEFDVSAADAGSDRSPEHVPTSRGIAESREIFKETSRHLQDRRQSHEILRFPDRHALPPASTKPRNQANPTFPATGRTPHKVPTSRPNSRHRGDFQRNLSTSCHSRPRERDIKRTRHARYPRPSSETSSDAGTKEPHPNTCLRTRPRRWAHCAEYPSRCDPLDAGLTELSVCLAGEYNGRTAV